MTLQLLDITMPSKGGFIQFTILYRGNNFQASDSETLTVLLFPGWLSDI